ncbi:MAG TPA: hypothetical protein VD997_00080 [Phycisphaerales bacterium]|nr:hypothetical protein [Phycisphaerales bacterium]
MKTLLAALLVLAAMIVTGCSTPSLNALASDETVVADTGIVGTWEPVNEDGKEAEEYYVVSDAGEKTYTVKLVKEGEEKGMQFSMQLVKLGDHQFIDLTMTRTDRDEVGERFGTMAAPMHNFFRCKRNGDALQIWPLEHDALEKGLKDGTFKLGHAEHGKEKKVVLTASTEDLQAFFKANAEHKDLWGDIGTLKRKAAKK